MRKLLSIITLLAAMFTANAARAASVSAGLLVGNGFKDGYNIGIGARVGVTLPVTPIYIGGTFVYHLGKTESTPNGDVTSKVLYFGVEGGYEAGVGPLTVRPYLGLGYASLTTNVPSFTVGGVSFSGSDTASKFALWPGATVLFGLGGAFVGLDARYVIITGADDANAFALFATAGLSF